MSETTANGVVTYKIDEAHSTVRFWVKHMMISKVHGEVPDVTGTVKYNPEAPELTEVDVNINLATFTTGQAQRDEHVKSPDFLDVASHPAMTFRSKKVTKTGPNEYDVVGDLTIRGVTREVSLKAEATDEVTSPFGGYKVGVSATGVVNRDEFDITYNQALESGGWLVGKEIHVQIDLELDRA